MTVDEVDEQPQATPHPRDPAIARYEARMRPLRIAYSAVVAVIVIAAFVFVGIAWSHGEVAHTTLHTAASPARRVPLQTPSSQMTLGWTTTDRTAIGTPYWNGTVITETKDSVRGRDARTGKVVWSYTRTDRTLCQAIQDQGVTLALFAVKGNCEELTALGSSTGKRRWTRTLDKDGQPLNGYPTYSVDSAEVLFVSDHAIYAVNPGSGQDWWVFDEDGCTIHSAVVGSSGALISQTCAKRSCKGVKFCGNGRQLLLRDNEKGEQTDSSKNNGNPDQIFWNLIGNHDTPASADALVSALEPNASTLDAFVTKTGKLAHKQQLPAPGSAKDLVSAPTSANELIWTNGHSYVFDDTGATLLWSAPTVSAPTVTLAAQSETGDILSIPSQTGIGTLDSSDGTLLLGFQVTPPATGSLVYPFGTGFLVTGATTRLYR